jgi:hypothetical protein
MSVDGAEWLMAELASYACGACGQPYGRGRVRLLAEREDLFFVDLACAHCGAQAVAIVTVRVDEEGGADLQAGDLAPAGSEPAPFERRPTPEAPPISTDDVLRVHELLAGFRGDARELLAHLDGRRA